MLIRLSCRRVKKSHRKVFLWLTVKCSVSGPIAIYVQSWTFCSKFPSRKSLWRGLKWKKGVSVGLPLSCCSEIFECQVEGNPERGKYELNMEGGKKFGIKLEIKRYCKKLASDIQVFIIFVSQRTNETSASSKILALNENDYSIIFPFTAFLIQIRSVRACVDKFFMLPRKC